jgi:hypothetical protein
MNAEDEFEEIARQAGERCAAVTCSLEEYISGLQSVIDEMETRKEAAEGDLRRQREE